jgi:hypothetical protein
MVEILRGYFFRNNLVQIPFSIIGARFARKKGGGVVQFSGFARKLNYIPSFFASEESTA